MIEVKALKGRNSIARRIAPGMIVTTTQAL